MLEFDSLGWVTGLALAACGLLSACAGPSAIYDKPESHFSYPNSNVFAVGHVRAEVSKTSLFFGEIGDPNLEQDAVRAALKDKESEGANILIDGRYLWSSKFITFPIPIFTTTLVVEGEAAKMELGNQVRARR